MANRTIRTVSPTGVVKDVLEPALHVSVQSGFAPICDVGTTAQRPTTGLFQGYKFYDTSLSKLIVWVGGGGGMSHSSAQTQGFWTDGTGSAV